MLYRKTLYSKHINLTTQFMTERNRASFFVSFQATVNTCTTQAFRNQRVKIERFIYEIIIQNWLCSYPINGMLTLARHKALMKTGNARIPVSKGSILINGDLALPDDIEENILTCTQ